MYRYFLDTTLLNPPGCDPNDEPQGWNQLVTTLKRDRVLKGIIKTIDVQMFFGGVGYDYLKNILDTQSFCGDVAINIQKSCDGGNLFTDFYKGIIFISDIEFDEKRCLAKCKISDNSFYAKINNNKSLECLPYVGTSKNGIVITPAPYKIIKFFNPVNGTYYAVAAGARSCTGFKVYDILAFLIAFMTDDEVAFDSTLFGIGGEWENLMLTRGNVLTGVQSGLDQDAFEEDFPQLTFETTFKELDRLLNLGFYVDYTTSKPTFRIESQASLLGTTTILSTPDINELKTSTAVDYLYNRIDIGNTSWSSNPSLSYPDGIDWLGFKEEQYTVLGVCNLDRSLDLTRDWIVDTNAIQDEVVEVSGANVDAIFIIDCEYVSGVTYNSVKTNVITPPAPPHYYNEAFTNNQIAMRYLGGVPNSISQWLGTDADMFQARRDAFTSGNISNRIPGLPDGNPIQFNDDFTPPNHDANNHYGNGTTQGNQISQANSRFTAYVSGIYSFGIFIKKIVAYVDNTTVLFSLDRYDSGNTLINFYSSPVTDLVTIGTHLDTELIIETIYLSEGDYVTVSQIGSAGGVIDDLNEYLLFYTTLIPSYGILNEYDPADYSVLLHAYEQYPFTDADYNTILANITERISFNRNGQTPRVGWIEQIKFHHGTGKMDVILNSNKKINS